MKKYFLFLAIILTACLPLRAQSFPDEMHMSADGRMLLLGDMPNTGLYDQSKIRTIYLTFAQSDYWTQLTNNYWSWTDAEIPATMVVDGVTYNNVGVCFRGQSSFQKTEPPNPYSDKKPFGISLDFVNPTQDIMGRKDLNLNNCYDDRSFIREIFYQHQVKKHIPIAKSAYVILNINGVDWGLYPNVQQLNKSFYKDWYLSAKGTSWRATRSSGIGFEDGDGTGGLNYLGPDTAEYQKEYVMKFTDKVNPWDDLVNTCDVLNNTPSATLPSVLPDKLDIDRSLWFLASEILFADEDSYVQKGRMDYCVYWERETGRIAPQEYDGNGVMNPLYQNWSPFYHEDSVNYPLMNRLFKIPEYRQRYLAHFRTLLSECFDPSAEAVIDGYKAQIDALVQSDPKKLYSYADFQNEVTVLKNFVAGRRAFLYAHPEIAETAPVISNVAWYVGGTPWLTPSIGQGATVRASAAGAAQLNMYYSNELVGNFTKVQMMDDGLNDDGGAGDGIYGASLAGQAFGTWTRFYIEAVSTNAAKSVSYDPPGAEHNVYAFQVGGVGINEPAGAVAHMSVFPNPANKYVEIEVDKNSLQDLVIMNSIGQQVYQEKFSKATTINTSLFPNGLYFLQCGSLNKKLVVQH